MSASLSREQRLKEVLSALVELEATQENWHSAGQVFYNSRLPKTWCTWVLARLCESGYVERRGTSARTQYRITGGCNQDYSPEALSHAIWKTPGADTAFTNNADEDIGMADEGDSQPEEEEPQPQEDEVTHTTSEPPSSELQMLIHGMNNILKLMEPVYKRMTALEERAKSSDDLLIEVASKIENAVSAFQKKDTPVSVANVPDTKTSQKIDNLSSRLDETLSRYEMHRSEIAEAFNNIAHLLADKKEAPIDLHPVIAAVNLGVKVTQDAVGKDKSHLKKMEENIGFIKNNIQADSTELLIRTNLLLDGMATILRSQRLNDNLEEFIAKKTSIGSLIVGSMGSNVTSDLDADKPTKKKT
jgi:predicted transcriptional regulator